MSATHYSSLGSTTVVVSILLLVYKVVRLLVIYFLFASHLKLPRQYSHEVSLLLSLPAKEQKPPQVLHDFSILLGSC
jgi:hypothetical protein